MTLAPVTGGSDHVDALLERLAADPDVTAVEPLVGLVRALRPSVPSDVASATRNIEALTERLLRRPEWAEAVRRRLRAQFAQRTHVHAYVDPGILSTEGLFQNVRLRLARKVLPDVPDDRSMYDLAAQVFDDPDDHEWVDGVSEDVWLRLIAAIDFSSGRTAAGPRIAYDRLLEAIEVLAHRIAAVGVEPELLRNYPDVGLFARPFVAQADEAQRFVASYRHALLEGTPPEDEKHLLVLLGQCKSVVARVRRDAQKRGASIALTWHLVRLTQQVARVEALLAILSPTRPEGDYRAPWRLCRDIVRAASRRTCIRDLFSETTDLLSMRVAANAARTGEHYITSTRSEYWRMARAATGAGAIVPLMAIAKAAIHALHLPPLPQTIAFGLNYAVGFVILHLLHLALATKQPAMTATALARSLGESDDQSNLEGLADTCVRVVRSQFIAILGNVAVAIPVAALAATALWAVVPRATAIADPHHYLVDIDPMASRALLHAAIAGVCLFTAGIVSGFYDNACAYNNVPARLAALGWLRRLIGPSRTDRLAAYVDHNAGALAGNVVLGFLLAGTGLIGWLTGLPIDIRHVTFSAANFGIALAWIEHVPAWTEVALVVVGLLGIGVVNLVVSFGLATFVAMRSHHVPMGRARRLLPLLWGRLKRTPASFVLPPAETATSITSNAA